MKFQYVTINLLSKILGKKLQPGIDIEKGNSGVFFLNITEVF